MVNTPSHLLITASLQKATRHRWTLPTSALLWGAVAPDLLLIVLSVLVGLHHVLLLGMGPAVVAERLFDDYFFNNVWWMAAHNLLHAPLVLLGGLALCWRQRFANAGLRSWLFWFFAACLLHTAIDIPLHSHDGPLLLFPFEWTVRFESSVSYWDPEHYGGLVFGFEIVLDTLLVVYLLVPWLRERYG